MLGVWLAISPWLLGFSGFGAAMWNVLIVGIVVAVLALWTLGTDKDIGGVEPGHLTCMRARRGVVLFRHIGAS